MSSRSRPKRLSLLFGGGFPLGAPVTSAPAVDLLAATSLFGALPADELATVAAATTRRSYGRGEFVFHEGDPGSELYVVEQGRVKVTVTSLDGDELILATLEPPGVFGELAAIDGGLRSASVQVLAATTLLVLGRDTLLGLLAERPRLADALLRSLGALVRRLSDSAADLVFLDLQARVAKLLVRLAGDGRRLPGGAVALHLPMSQQDLAAAVGGARQTVNQVLQTLERRGYVERRGREVVVKDLDGLRRRAGLVGPA